MYDSCHREASCDSSRASSDKSCGAGRVTPLPAALSPRSDGGLARRLHSDLEDVSSGDAPPVGSLDVSLEHEMSVHRRRDAPHVHHHHQAAPLPRSRSVEALDRAGAHTGAPRVSPRAAGGHQAKERLTKIDSSRLRPIRQRTKNAVVSGSNEAVYCS